MLCNVQRAPGTPAELLVDQMAPHTLAVLSRLSRLELCTSLRGLLDGWTNVALPHLCTASQRCSISTCWAMAGTAVQVTQSMRCSLPALHLALHTTASALAGVPLMALPNLRSLQWDPHLEAVGDVGGDIAWLSQLTNLACLDMSSERGRNSMAGQSSEGSNLNFAGVCTALAQRTGLQGFCTGAWHIHVVHSGASVTQLARVLAQLIGLTRLHAFVLAGTPVVMPAHPAAIAPSALLHLQLSVVYGAQCDLRMLDWLATWLQQLPQLAHLSGRSCASEADEG